MPMQKGVSPFNINKSLNTHKADETDYGQDFTRLPGGITGGIARLIDCKISTYKQGKLQGKEFFRAAGVVVFPDSAVETVKRWNADKKVVELVGPPQVKQIKGLQTSVMIPLCDTGSGEKFQSTDDHVADMCNEIRKLGGENFLEDMDDDSQAKTAGQHKGLAQKMKDLVESGIHFRFGTNASDPNATYPDQRVWERWYGSKGLEDYAPDEPEAVEDETGEPADEEAVEETDEAEEETTDTEAEAEETEETEESEEESEETSEMPEDPDQLAEICDGDDEEAANAAQEKLGQLALDAGMSQEDIEGADNWAAVADAMRDQAKRAKAAKAKAAAKPSANGSIAKDAICDLLQINPKTKKKVKVEVEVVSVDKAKRLATVRDMTTKKLLKGIKFADLKVTG